MEMHIFGEDKKKETDSPLRFNEQLEEMWKPDGALRKRQHRLFAEAFEDYKDFVVNNRRLPGLYEEKTRRDTDLANWRLNVLRIGTDTQKQEIKDFDKTVLKSLKEEVKSEKLYQRFYDKVTTDLRREGDPSTITEYLNRVYKEDLFTFKVFIEIQERVKDKYLGTLRLINDIESSGREITLREFLDQYEVAGLENRIVEGLLQVSPKDQFILTSYCLVKFKTVTKLNQKWV